MGQMSLNESWLILVKDVVRVVDGADYAGNDKQNGKYGVKFHKNFGTLLKPQEYLMSQWFQYS